MGAATSPEQCRMHTTTSEPRSEQLVTARSAYERHDWPEAHQHFAAADESEALGPTDLEAYGEAAWWLASLEEAITLRERAYRAHLRSEDRVGAARVALWLFLDYTSRLRSMLAVGALTRADRQLRDEPQGTVHGQLAVMQSFAALQQGDHVEAKRLAVAAADIARRFHDADLESLSFLMQGRAMVASGDVTEGLVLLDQATSAAVGGDLSPFATGVVYCASISACRDLSDYRRAGEWTEAAERWCHEQAVDSGFPGTCRVYRAEVKRFQGDWPQAEEEARQAARELEESFLDVVGAAHNEIGEVRLRMSDLDAAEDAFGKAHAAGHEAQPGISLLRLAQGRPGAAASSIRAALDNPYLQPLGRAKLLPAQVEIALASDDVDRAASAVDELDAIADTYRGPSPVLRAQALHARAALALAQGEPQEALEHARRALRHWQQVRAPYEVAQGRMLLARAYRALGDHDTAALEARSAKTSFEQLGARTDARRAAGLSETQAPARQTTQTFLFTDIVTSTSLLEAIGDEAWNDLVRWHDRTLREEFRAHGGEEVDHAGDGFFVAFPSASAALACAIKVQRRLDEHRHEHGFAPQVRIGLHTADALRVDDGYRGKGVHEAARIAALASAGQILASKAVLDEADTAAAADGMTAVRLKGLREPVSVGEVSWKA